MTTMNINQLVNALYKGTCVKVTFEPLKRDAKLYTYKSPIDNVRVGDKLFVYVSNELETVTVVEVGDEQMLDLSVNYIYKWVCGRATFPDYEATLIREQLLKDSLSNKQRAAMRERILGEAGLLPTPPAVVGVEEEE
jgi:hypothetical protein